jgi:hypothetical protein
VFRRYIIPPFSLAVPVNIQGTVAESGWGLVSYSFYLRGRRFDS